ncbi:unnamed protein product [Acanthoscelides obtectus]|uniref:Uncharacterized protein n=1 Tax=Acanthoscelides obtectus TaxID=200917 RepID=A0A9P0P3R5_ACAOB|nr:unnamed protein product [Acanthoscelides obtectus]CAK1683192.1 hypothetical protein AOBTE_LOCUS34126 [Acanthoscelides obtectus]
MLVNIRDAEDADNRVLNLLCRTKTLSTRYCYNIAPRKKTRTKEEILQKKRDAEWKKYERLKNDPRRREELREKGHLKYLKKEKERGTRKLVKDMTPRDHRLPKNYYNC